MRLELYYERILRRDFLDKFLYNDVTQIIRVEGVDLLLVCGGLSTFYDLKVLKGILLLELFGTLKGSRITGVTQKTKGVRLYARKRGFEARLSLRRRALMYNFIDSWCSLVHYLYKNKGGIVSQGGGNGVSLTYKNVGDYLTLPSLFFRLKTTFIFRIFVSGGQFEQSLLLAELKLI